MDTYLEEVMRCARSIVTERRGPGCTLEPTSPLSELLDSFHWILLVAQLEKSLKIKFNQSDLANPSDWATCDSINALVARVHKRAAHAKA